MLLCNIIYSSPYIVQTPITQVDWERLYGNQAYHMQLLLCYA